MTELIRCDWCGTDPFYVKYHDEEWGKPVYDDKTLFEFLILEGAQAGLSWITILRRREGYRKAFADFDVKKVAGFDEADVERLMNDTGIIKENTIEVVLDIRVPWVLSSEWLTSVPVRILLGKI